VRVVSRGSARRPEIQCKIMDLGPLSDEWAAGVGLPVFELAGLLEFLEAEREAK